jgi:predicted amidohydrolase
MMIGSFLAIGMAAEDVRKMVQDNPARLLGLDRLPCPHGHGPAG